MQKVRSFGVHKAVNSIYLYRFSERFTCTTLRKNTFCEIKFGERSVTQCGNSHHEQHSQLSAQRSSEIELVIRAIPVVCFF